MSDKREILEGVVLDKKAPLPLLTHIINTHNEGDDVRQTLISFRAAYSGPYRAIVVADETTDGSCDGLETLLKAQDKCPRCIEGGLHSENDALQCTICGFTFKWQDGDRIDVINNKPRVGCGKAKEQAQLMADPDSVIIHSDGHCRWMMGSLDEAVRIAAQNQVIVAPGVAPLHCPPDEQPRMGKEWGDRATKWKKNHSTWGGRIQVDALGAKVDACARPGKTYAFRETTFWAIFMMSAKTLRERLGGWNKLPGRWGSQEIGLGLRAWFADVPVVTMRDAVAGHRYRADQRKDGKPYAPYRVGTHERRVNTRYTHELVFSPKTCKKVWRRNWDELCPSQGAKDKLKVSDLVEQGKYYRTNCKKKTDADFMAAFCPNGWPTNLVPVKDITAVVLCYKRPVNQQKCIDAIKKAGIKVWAWCNESAKTPKGCERIFTDSMNASTWGRYLVAPLIDTKWILFCDDDVELTDAGIRALRAGGALGIDNSGLIGARFTPPNYDDYHARKYYKSHKIREAVPVDMLWPKGQLILRDLAIQLFGAGNEAWQDMRDTVGSTSGDDLVATIMQERLCAKGDDGKDMCAYGRFAHVVQSSGKGYREHHAEGKEHSLTKQKGRINKKRKTMKIWREKYGWRSVEEHKGEGE